MQIVDNLLVPVSLLLNNTCKWWNFKAHVSHAICFSD